MSKFSPSPQNKVDPAKAKAIVDYGINLGCSRSSKDCYWTCYQWCGNFYIGLNGDYNVWEADRNDIYDYCDVTTAAYEQMMEEGKATEAADKASSIKYSF